MVQKNGSILCTTRIEKLTQYLGAKGIQKNTLTGNPKHFILQAVSHLESLYYLIYSLEEDPYENYVLSSHEFIRFSRHIIWSNKELQ